MGIVLDDAKDSVECVGMVLDDAKDIPPTSIIKCDSVPSKEQCSQLDSDSAATVYAQNDCFFSKLNATQLQHNYDSKIDLFAQNTS